jgi:hypothetical protein
MNHPYNKANLTSTFCQTCGKDEIAHTDKATCEKCGVIGLCDYYPSVKKLWCPRCVGEYVREQNANSKALKTATAELHTQVPVTSSLFNAKVMSFVELKKTIDGDETIQIDQKERAYHMAIRDRIMWCQDKNVEEEKAISERKVEIMAGNHLLRQFGDAVSAEIIEQIKKNDADYNVQQIKKAKKVDPRLGVKKKSAFDKMVENYMKASGKTYEESKKFLEQGEHWKE